MNDLGSAEKKFLAEAASVAIAAVACALFYALGAFSAQFALTILMYAVVGLLLARRLGLLDARVIFFVSAAVYSTAGSVDYYVFDDFGRYGEDLNARILAIGTGFMAGAGVVLVGWARLTGDPPFAHKRSQPLLWLPVATLLMLGLYISLSIRSFGLSIGEIDRATLTSEQSTVAALARGLAVATIVAWVWLLTHVRSRFYGYVPAFLALIALTTFDLLFFGDRRVILSMLLAVGFLLLNKKRALWWLTPVLAAAFAGLLLLAAVRGQPLQEWFAILQGLDVFAFLSPVNLDFGGFPLMADDVLSSPSPIVSTAPTYLEGLVAAIPSTLYPGRPQAFSVWYVQTFHADIAAIGGGLASNWVVESLVNLGSLGPIATGVATAAGLNRLCSTRARWPRLNNAAAMASFAFVMRYDLTSFVQVFGGITAVAIVLGRYAGEARCHELASQDNRLSQGSGACAE